MRPLILKINRRSVESNSSTDCMTYTCAVANRYWHTRKVQHYVTSRVYEPRLTDYSKAHVYLPPEGHGLTNWRLETFLSLYARWKSRR